MKKKMITLVGVGVAGAALVLSGTSATAGQAPKVTGGGQINASTGGGAGDTIAFTAQGVAEAVKGQVQYVDRSGGGGAMHGAVECLEVMDNMARLGGMFRDGTTFEIYVQDNGEGANSDPDTIEIVTPATLDCQDDDEQNDGSVALARGNAQVHPAKPAE